jgi:hypothetical protein
MVDRLNMKTMLRRRNMNVLGTMTPSVYFARTIVRRILIICSLAANLPRSVDGLLAYSGMNPLACSRGSLLPRRSAIYPSSESLFSSRFGNFGRLIRNDKVFNRSNVSFSLWFCNFKSQCLLFKEDIRSSFCYGWDAIS